MPEWVSELVEATAARVVDLLDERDRARADDGRLLPAAELAGALGVTRGWVYEHADELEAIRLGEGARPRLRSISSVLALR